MVLDALDALDLASMHSRIFLEAWSSSLFRSAKFTVQIGQVHLARVRASGQQDFGPDNGRIQNTQSIANYHVEKWENDDQWWSPIKILGQIQTDPNSMSSFHLSSNTRPFSSSVAIFVPWVLETRVLPQRSEPPSFGVRGRAALTVRSGDVWGPGRSCAPWTLSPLFSGVKHGWEVPSPGEIAIFTCKILGKYGEKPLEMKVYSREHHLWRFSSKPCFITRG